MIFEHPSNVFCSQNQDDRLRPRSRMKAQRIKVSFGSSQAHPDAGCCQKKGVDGKHPGGNSPQPAKENFFNYIIMVNFMNVAPCFSLLVDGSGLHSSLRIPRSAGSLKILPGSKSKDTSIPLKSRSGLNDAEEPWDFPSASISRLRLNASEDEGKSSFRILLSWLTS